MKKSEESGMTKISAMASTSDGEAIMEKGQANTKRESEMCDVASFNEDEEVAFENKRKQRLQIGGNHGGTGGTLADDIVRGAMNIAELLYGGRTKKARRKVYHLAGSSNMPFFKIGSTLCIRRSKLEEYIAEQERRNGRPKR